MLIFAVGDVVGEAGCAFLLKHLPSYKRMNGIDICVVNGENSAPGNGITPSSCKELFLAGADVVTTGNHAYTRREVAEFFDSEKFVLRPANYHPENPGKGFCVVDRGRYRVGVVNLMGTAFMEPLDNPFICIDRVLKELSDCTAVLVDFHAEATSEKKAMAYYLDGRVGALFGTHTHVQTADEQILPKGTAYISDLGMTGVGASVLGLCPEAVIKKFKYHTPVRFESAKGECVLSGCLFEIDEKTGKALSAERVNLS